MPDSTPFIVTIDTEGDDQWSRSSEITTRNANYLPRFQALCERYGYKPVYLTNYEMAKSGVFTEFGRDVLARDAGEIGLHVHAWNSPPLEALTDNDFRHHPYLPEYSKRQMRGKVKFLTDLLEDTFGTKMVSHRAGRWGLDARYARILLDCGYLVDCSVTPGLDWRANRGAPWGGGGPDFRDFPSQPYYMGVDDIAVPAERGLLEVPMTVRAGDWYRHAPWLYDVRLLRRLANRLSPGLTWLCPVQTTLRAPLQRNLRAMIDVARSARGRALPHLQFMVHSSELMPGGSPIFRGDWEIEALYDALEELFEESSGWCHGSTLAEFHAGFVAKARGVSRTLEVDMPVPRAIPGMS